MDNQSTTNNIQKDYTDKMVKHLPVLRASLRITQRELAEKIGITRQSMMAIETSKRPLQWSTYLALVLVFQKSYDTRILLDRLEIFNEDVI